MVTGISFGMSFGRFSAPSWVALGVFLGALLASLVLWQTGVDVRLQAWLWLNYSQDFNSWMRILSSFALGRTQLMVCLSAALVWALILHDRESEGRRRALVWRMFLGVVEQLWLWVRGRWVWASCWARVALGPRVLMAVVPLLALTGLAQLLMKFVIGRPRPKVLFFYGGDPFVVKPFHFEARFWSLPSGHSASTFAVLVWLALWFPRWRVPALAVALVFSSSRFLAVTPHYLGDVVAGAGLGAAIAMALFAAMGGRTRV